jgi:hypothetical protein
MIYRGPGFLAVVACPPPYREQVVFLSQSSCVSPVELILTGDGGGGGRGAKSYSTAKNNLLGPLLPLDKHVQIHKLWGL